MNKQRFRLLLYSIFPLLAAGVGAVLVFLGYRYNSDLLPIDNVYTALLFKENFFTGALIGFLLFAVVLALSAIIPFKKDVLKPRTQDTATTFARTAVGLFFLGTVVMQYLLRTAGTPYVMDGSGAIFQKISLVAAVLSALYFLLPVFVGKGKKEFPLFGLFVLAWLTAQLIVSHYFMSEFLSSPNRIFPILSLAALLFFMMSELRILRFKNSAPGSYIAWGLAAFILTFSEAAPRLVLSFMKEAGMVVNLSSFYTLLRLALGIYAFLSAVNALFASGQPMEEIPQSAEPAEETPEESKAVEAVSEESEETSSTEEKTEESCDAEGPSSAEEQEAPTAGEEPTAETEKQE